MQSDSQGFLLGERRLLELNKGVNNVQENTEAILAILMQLGDIERRSGQSTEYQLKKIDTSIKALSAKASRVTPAAGRTVGEGPSRVVQTAMKASGSTLENGRVVSVKEPTKPGKTAAAVPARDASGHFVSSADLVAKEAGRDEKGRFTSQASKLESPGFIDAIKRGIDGSRMGMDTQGFDPTVDAVHELNTLISPAGRAFKGMGRAALWMFKKAVPKRNEDLPLDQNEHYDEVEKHNYEQRKLLKKLIEAVNRQNNGGLLKKLLAAAGLGSGLLEGGGRGRRGKDGRNIPVPAPEGKDKKIPPGPGVPGKDKPSPKSPKLGKLGGLLGRVPMVGALLGGGLLASQWGEMSTGDKGAGIGSLIGGGIGGMVGAFGGPVGAVAGAGIGSMLGDSVGRRFGEWTGELRDKDIGGQIVSTWTGTLDTINKFIQDSWNKKFGKTYMDNTGGRFAMGGGMMQVGYRMPGGGGGFGGGGGGYPGIFGPSSNTTTSVTSSQEAKANQQNVYAAMRSAGFSESQAMALTAEVGRENGYASDLLYGSHADQANGLTNMGMISWQGKRAERLKAYMAQKGLIDKNGKMVRSQASLVAQAEFMKKEIEKDKAYSATHQMFKDNPHADPEQYARILGKNYIGWAYGQDRLKSGKAFNWRQHDAVRRTYLQELQKNKNGQNNAKQPQQQPGTTPTAKPLMVSNNSVSSGNQARPLYASGSPKVNAVQVSKTPNVLKKESGQGKQPLLMAQSATALPQNVGDRNLAHALGGGLGMRMLTV